MLTQITKTMLELALSLFTPSLLKSTKKKLKDEIKDYFDPKKKIIIEFFEETKNSILIPRFFALRLFPSLKIDPTWKRPIQKKLTLNGTLMQTTKRPQVLAFHDTMKQLETKTGASLILGCGTGKTVIAIALAIELQQKCLILVHKSFLMDQWEARIRQFVKEDVNIGIIKQDKCETEDCQFVIASVQSLLSAREYPKEALSYGLLIVDESHHSAASCFSRCFNKLQYYYSLSLTATPKRKDGLEQRIYDLLGSPSYVHNTPSNNNVQVNMLTYNSGSCKEHFIRGYGSKKKLNFSKMITVLTDDHVRNNLIIKVVQLMRRQYPKRQGLLLGHRVKHLKYLYSRLDPEYTALITGSINSEKKKMKGKKRKREEIHFDKFLTLSTYSMASEGMDMMNGSFIILATPMTRIEQAIGRVMRGKVLDRPVIIDIVDPFSLFKIQSYTRRKLYTTRGFEIIRVSDKDIMQA